MAQERDDLVYLAKLAEQAERFDPRLGGPSKAKAKAEGHSKYAPSSR